MCCINQLLILHIHKCHMCLRPLDVGFCILGTFSALYLAVKLWHYSKCHLLVTVLGTADGVDPRVSYHISRQIHHNLIKTHGITFHQILLSISQRGCRLVQDRCSNFRSIQGDMFDFIILGKAICLPLPCIPVPSLRQSVWMKTFITTETQRISRGLKPFSW